MYDSDNAQETTETETVEVNDDAQVTRADAADAEGEVSMELGGDVDELLENL